MQQAGDRAKNLEPVLFNLWEERIDERKGESFSGSFHMLALPVAMLAC